MGSTKVRLKEKEEPKEKKVEKKPEVAKKREIRAIVRVAGTDLDGRIPFAIHAYPTNCNPNHLL